LFAEDLLDRADQPRMAAEQAERLVIGMRGKGGARRPGLFAPDLLPVGGIDRLGLVAQRRDLGFGKTPRQEQIAVLDEWPQLLRAELHRVPPAAMVVARRSARRAYHHRAGDKTPRRGGGVSGWPARTASARACRRATRRSSRGRRSGCGSPLA